MNIFNFTDLGKCNRAVMLYKMLHSSVKFSPDPPSFQDYTSVAIADLNADDFPIDECCESVVDPLATDIRAVTNYIYV